MTIAAVPRLDTYADLRTHFLEAAAQAGAQLFEYAHPLRGLQDEPLFTDVARLGRADAKKWLLVVSGTHGVEGYYGSVCQALYLRQLAQRGMDEAVGVLMVHLINPWGTAWKRRVNEDNIDLNRNYLDFSQPVPVNQAYEEIHPLFTVERASPQGRQKTQREWLQIQQRLGRVALKSKLEAGQYAHPDGLFYGGSRAAWSNRTLREIVGRFLPHASDAISLDLHTGAGPYGHPMLMAIAEHDYPGMQDLQRLYGPWLYSILTRPGQVTDTDISAEVTGYTSQAMVDMMAGVRFAQLVVECGTYDGATRGHQSMLDDHFLHLQQHFDGPDFHRIKAEILEFFYPDDSDWRELTWVRTRQILDRALAALAARA
ncbi:DUF2817 domain-containing protein [Castellaniella hirudinis]|uniref:DUF2817 domain-containing protein n=1 Tax=Castellaniella hirudinis TaxID=1144617 RepID=UPI0039C18F51